MSMPTIVPVTSTRPAAAPRWRRLACLAACIGTLAACGGGGGDDAVSEGGGGTTPVASPALYANGVLSGVGTLQVNGVAYNASQATVVDADGNAGTPDALALGMVVEVLATAAQDGSAASASVVRYRSEVEGPLTSVAGNTLVVLGQTVLVDGTTVFEDGRLATLAVGQVLEVHGPRDAAGRILASRIEVEDDLDDLFQLRGTATALSPAVGSFRIGDATVAYGSLPAATQALLTEGAAVRVQLQPTPTATGAWTAAALRLDTPLSSGGGDTATGPQAELEGAITRMDSATRFVVDGIVVDASAATRLPTGLAVGSLVEVSGRLVAGVLQATEVEREDRLGADAGFEIEGRIASLGNGSFVLRGVTVDYATARFTGGTAAQLAVGVEVEVRATLSADGSTLVANSVAFDD